MWQSCNFVVSFIMIFKVICCVFFTCAVEVKTSMGAVAQRCAANGVCPHAR